MDQAQGSGHLKTAALELLAGNRRSGLDLEGRPLRFSCPAPSTYPFQWFWDSCFHAIALAHLQPAWAVEELEALAGSQQPDGFMPHVTFHGGARISYWAFVQGKGLRPRSSAMIQPPVFGYALRRVADLSGDKDLLRELLPVVDRYHQWLFRERDYDSDSLISIVSPYESGLDHKPAYDAPMGSRSGRARTLTPRLRRLDLANKRRGFDLRRNVAARAFHAEDVLVNTFLSLSLFAVAAAHRSMGDQSEEEKSYRQAEEVRDALLAKCWDEEAGLFWDLFGPGEGPLKVPTITGLVPLALPGLPASVVTRIIDNLKSPAFWTQFPIPSVPSNHKTFTPGQPYSGRSPLIWRGGTWINTNWLLQLGLIEYGYHDLARQLAETSAQLVEEHGFREFYNPLSGEGYGARGFGWSTLIVDMLAMAERCGEPVKTT